MVSLRKWWPFDWHLWVRFLCPGDWKLYRFNLSWLRFVCSKLQLLFLNANIKINDLVYPTVCGLKAMFSDISFALFNIAGIFFLLLELIFADQVPSAKTLQNKSANSVTPSFCDSICCKRKTKKNGLSSDKTEKKCNYEAETTCPSLVCGINVCLFIATPDMHDMQENVRQSNLQLVFCRLFHLKRDYVTLF